MTVPPTTPDKLPPHAQLAFRGQIFEVWQWEQKLYDGSTAIFERLKRPDTAEVITVVGDKICIQLQEQPGKPEFYSLPGGRCETGETLLQAAQRELLEEAGYTSDDWVLWKEYQPYGKIVWTIGIYVARNCRLIQEPHLDAGEKITNKFVTFDEFIMLCDEPAFHNSELKQDLLRVRYDAEAREKLRQVVFGS